MLRIALGQYDTGWHDPRTSLARAASVIRGAAGASAGLVILPEMCTTGFTMDPAQAEPFDGPAARELAGCAAAARIPVVAGLAAREEAEGTTRLVNAAVLFGAAGDTLAVYRKQRVFAYAGEHAVYSPGTEPVVATVGGVRLALFVCYDLRFPELFRAVAADVDAMVVIANWPAARRTHWEALTRARAIENQCYLIGVNRTGSGGGIAYDGGSVAFDPWGEPAVALAHGARCVDVDPRRVAAVRAEYPFLRDMR